MYMLAGVSICRQVCVYAGKCVYVYAGRCLYMLEGVSFFWQVYAYAGSRVNALVCVWICCQV